MMGAVIGAGVFSLPYVIVKSGWVLGAFWLLLGTVVVTLIHLFYADLVLMTSGKHNFVGLNKIYSGNFYAAIALVASLVQMFFELLVYLVLTFSFAKIMGISSGLGVMLIFWATASAAIFLSLKKLEFLETFITVAVIVIIFLLFSWSLPNINNLKFELKSLGESIYWLLPLAPIIFSLNGRVGIVETIRVTKRRDVRGVILAGTIIPAIIYLLFIVAAFNLSTQVTPDGITGLLGALPNFFLFGIGILGLLCIWSSYVIMGYDMEDVMRFDLKMHGSLRVLLVIFLPLFLYFLGFSDLTALVSFIGGIFLGVEAFLIIKMWWRAVFKMNKKSFIFKTRPVGLMSLVGGVFVIVLLAELAKYL